MENFFYLFSTFYSRRNAKYMLWVIFISNCPKQGFYAIFLHFAFLDYRRVETNKKNFQTTIIHVKFDEEFKSELRIKLPRKKPTNKFRKRSKKVREIREKCPKMVNFTSQKSIKKFGSNSDVNNKVHSSEVWVVHDGHESDLKIYIFLVAFIVSEYLIWKLSNNSFKCSWRCSIITALVASLESSRTPVSLVRSFYFLHENCWIYGAQKLILSSLYFWLTRRYIYGILDSYYTCYML